MIKKVVQQGRSDFGARSVLPVREHDKLVRTPLTDFFIFPDKEMEEDEGKGKEGENNLIRTV